MSRPTEQTSIFDTYTPATGSHQSDDENPTSNCQKVQNVESQVLDTSKPTTAVSQNVDPRLLQFVIMEPQEWTRKMNAAKILRSSAIHNSYKLEFDYDEGGASTQCTINLEGCLVADVIAGNKHVAKNQASEEALQFMRNICWTIVTKQDEEVDETPISRDEILGNIKFNIQDSRICDSNIGHRLLKKMGWLGGGLGKQGNEGIVEPIITGDVNRKKEGFGLKAEQSLQPNFLTKMKNIISNYAKSDNQKDLIFSPTFSKEERTLIITEAHKLRLKTHSHGAIGDRREERFLVLSRKRTPDQLLSHVKDSGGETGTYFLRPPSGRPEQTINKCDASTLGNPQPEKPDEIIPVKSSHDYHIDDEAKTSNSQNPQNLLVEEAPSFDTPQTSSSSPSVDPRLLKFILKEPRIGQKSTNARHVLQQNATKNGYELDLGYHNQGAGTQCIIHLGSCLIANVIAGNKIDARNQAYEEGLQFMRSICWTIQTKPQLEAYTTGKRKDGGMESGNVIKREGFCQTDEQGIDHGFLTKVKQVLSDYIRSDRYDDMTFSPHFTGEERSLIHNEAHKIGLQAHIHGTSNQRHVVTSRRRTIEQLYSHVKDSGGETDKYILIPPSRGATEQSI